MLCNSATLHRLPSSALEQADVAKKYDVHVDWLPGNAARQALDKVWTIERWASGDSAPVFVPGTPARLKLTINLADAICDTTTPLEDTCGDGRYLVTAVAAYDWDDHTSGAQTSASLVAYTFVGA